MKAIILDAGIWAVFSAVGIAARSFFPTPHGVPVGGFANSHNIIACVTAGTAWILLRAAYRHIARRLMIRSLRIMITIAILPLAIIPVYMMQNYVDSSRLILLFPFFFAGVVWGSIAASHRAFDTLSH